MIKFFRKIRQRLLTENKFNKYILYAIGEIALVMIGILLALQVNNRNNNRIEYNQISDYALSLIQNLEHDIDMVKVIIHQSEEIAKRIERLGKYVERKRIEEISNIDVLCLTWIQIYRPYSWNRATIDQLKNSGSLRLIKNKALSNIIVKYDAFSHHMDEDYYNDKAQSENSTQLISKVINNNYPNIHELSTMLLTSIYAGEEVDIFRTEEYKIAKAHNLGLITTNLFDVHHAVNNFLRLQYNLRIRTKRELPKLIEDAEALITMLKSTYDIK